MFPSFGARLTPVVAQVRHGQTFTRGMRNAVGRQCVAGAKSTVPAKVGVGESSGVAGQVGEAAESRGTGRRGWGSGCAPVDGGGSR